MKIQKAIWGITAFIVFVAAPLSTRAAEDEPDRWQFITAPYVWGSGLEGDATVRGVDFEIDIGFDDLLDATEMGFQTYLELRKRQFGFFAAPSYLKLAGDGHAGPLSVDVEQQWWTVEGGGFYNLVNTGGDTPFTLDLIAGVRYWNIDTDISIEGGGPLGVDLDIGSTFEILDPMVGIRMREYITRKLSIAIRGDVGGFGISEGETSDFSWQALGLLGYDLSRRFTLMAGYRAVGLDAQEDSGNSFDVIFQGVLVGLQVRW